MATGAQPTILEFACELIRRPSVTPDDAGCQALIATRLQQQGFDVEPMPFGDVTNLWARRGSGGPLVVLAGHTDVVPAGPVDAWRAPPFEPEVRNGVLYGRGAADMKASLAAMLAATERFTLRYPDHSGSIAYLLTSDEEGDAINGTVRVVEQLRNRGVRLDYCLVGEPSSSRNLGDVVRIGRRGSLNARLKVVGVQGHVAYPDMARNPIHAFASALVELTGVRWDEGNEHFPPTSLQFSNIHAGTGASNVIPGALEAAFNFRFCTEQTAQGLQQQVAAILDRHDLEYDLQWTLSGEPFITLPGKLTSAVQASIESVTGSQPELSTSGGTSDGRFIAPTGCEVVELGPVNATIHKVDECTAVGDLEPLARIYEGVLERLLTGS